MLKISYFPGILQKYQTVGSLFSLVGRYKYEEDDTLKQKKFDKRK